MEIIDLSRILNNETVVYPGTVPPKINASNTIERDGFREKELQICSHFGTHIDAPAHILPQGKTLDELPVDQFIGKAIIINVAGASSISKDTIEGSMDGRQVDFIIFSTGWEDKWGGEAYFEDFPILTKEAAIYLVSRKLKGVGFDCISPDRVGDEELAIHKILLGGGMIIIENLCNLKELGYGLEFEFQCFPLKIEDADGSPVRAIARIL